MCTDGIEDTLPAGLARPLIADNALRLLLIAYEFPPSPSPQSLRWQYLARELVALGVEVHVLTAENWWPSTSTSVPPGVVLHRTWPGGTAGLVALSRRWRRLRGSGRPAPVAAPAMPAHGGAGEALNWKGRVLERLNRLVARFTFPDERGRWEPSARRKLRELLDTLHPDVVISSHEPATTLRPGRIAKQRGFLWVADLGDPVLSFYTPARWQDESRELERWTCRNADCVTVTTEAAKQMLATRHEVPESRFAVLTQGYDSCTGPRREVGVEFERDRLELLYTGRFYRFREPRALVDAVLAAPHVRLTIATSRAPEWLLPLVDEHPDRLRLLGFVPHAEAVLLQRAADVLVNIANEDPVHVPGKVYEYLGAGRPILHLGGGGDDEAARLVRHHGRGLVTGNDAGSIGAALAELVSVKREGSWDERFSLGQDGVEQYQWRSIAKRLHGLLGEVVGAYR